MLCFLDTLLEQFLLSCSEEQLPTPELAPEPAPEPAPGHDEAVLSQVDESKEEDVAAILAAAPKEAGRSGRSSSQWLTAKLILVCPKTGFSH